MNYDMSEYRKEGKRRLAAGENCSECKDKDTPATVVHATHCHGYFFFCDIHEKDYQDAIKETNKEYGIK